MLNNWYAITMMEGECMIMSCGLNGLELALGRGEEWLVAVSVVLVVFE